MVGELADELSEEVESTQNASGTDSTHHFKEILADLKSNAERIVVHGKRADGIVRSMLEHARATSTERRAIDLNALVTEYVDRALHGRRGQSPTHASIRARIPEFNIEIAKDLDESVGEIRVAPQEIGRVLLNLLSNAFDAVSEHDQPVVRVQTRRAADAIEIRVADNGPGIPVNLRQKIYEPFFTTKPTGSGTGLGLSLSYDIITQGYGGTLSVECEEGEATTFIVTLPVNQTKAGTSS
jgi:signal transduction histidine kinase